MARNQQMKAKLITYKDRHTQADALSALIVTQIKERLKIKDKVSLSVPGGTTPAAFFETLSKTSEINWAQIHITLGDERWVDIDNPRSNYALLTRHLNKNCAKSAHFYPLYQNITPPEHALPDLEENLSPLFPLDICVVGMGLDMHTASLFPKADGLKRALEATNQHHFTIIRPLGDEIRISLCAHAFNTATYCHVLICGTDKLDALKKAQHETASMRAPIRLLLMHENTHIHFAP